MYRITVYSRRGCHLCEDLLAELEPLVRGRAVIEVVDIDSDRRLVEDYDIRIPVVCVDGEEICHYRLDRQALNARLGRPDPRAAE